MIKKVNILKEVVFKTTFGLVVYKLYDQEEMNEDFSEAFVKKVYKIYRKGNEIVFVFEDRSFFKTQVKKIVDLLSDNSEISKLNDLYKFAEEIKKIDPLDKGAL